MQSFLLTKGDTGTIAPDEILRLPWRRSSTPTRLLRQQWKNIRNSWPHARGATVPVARHRFCIQGRSATPKTRIYMRRLLKVDVLAGFMFMAFAAWGFWASLDLDPGTSVSMGAGYFPRLISGLLLALGIAIAGAGFLPAAAAVAEDWSIRPLLFVSVAALAFALLLQRAGIVIAISVTVIIGSFAGERLRPFDLLLLIGLLIFASIALFVWGIGIPLPIWPSWQN